MGFSRMQSASIFRTNHARRLYRYFICTTAKETACITRLRSYSLLDKLDIPATICDASAATGFFDSLSIGARRFVDGALGANNPVDELAAQATANRVGKKGISSDPHRQ